MRTLADATRTRDNNFTLLRLAAATLVIWFHSYALTPRIAEEPIYNALDKAFDPGFLGVLAFFAMSGFLVTKSYAERASPLSFVAARVLRIFPGLLAATLFTFAIGAACTTLPLAAYLADPMTLDYLWHTATGWDVRHYLPGVFTSNPYPHSVNGSLWTLPMELKMYVGCLAAGVLGLVRRRWAFNVAFVAGVAFFAWHPEWFPVNPGLWAARQLGLAFAFGAFAWVNRDWIPLTVPALGVALAVMLLAPKAIGLQLLFVPLFVYLLLAIAMHPRLLCRRCSPPGDYSYGLYIYAFPIQQVLLMVQPLLAPLFVFAIALPLTLLVAIPSWHLLERPALALKPHSRRGALASAADVAQRAAT